MASAISASFHEMRKMKIATPMIVKTCWKKKMRP